ncbi:hypothetical protein K431DRAFT_282998 [Polychaeton citri CBS 116435]|uniref:F-box domain-containing protein n=1 Tax=Polychaeton citri CBS 116435 TaxID=1314669 RepID=A0A9P4QAD6_9PEZI|nr:hypothetical protein K431DRAFT_282998 [Polychaeton citri CBS 116435]
MPSTLSLSTELLQSRVRNLDQSDKHHLTLTCRQLQEVVEVELYWSVTWKWFHQKPATSSPFHRLLENVLDRPQIANQIHHLNVSEIGFGSKPQVGDVLSTSSLHKCNNLLRSIDIANTAGWARKLASGCVETMIVLLLS